MKATLPGHEKAGVSGEPAENSGFRATEARLEGLYGHTSHVRTGTLRPIIEERGDPDSIVCTDMFSANNAWHGRDFHQHRIDHSGLFAKQGNHINGEKSLEPCKATCTQIQRLWTPGTFAGSERVRMAFQ